MSQLTEEQQKAVGVLARITLESSESFSTIVGADGTGRMAILLVYPICCMEHAEEDLRSFRRMLVSRGIADPSIPAEVSTDQAGNPIPNLFERKPANGPEKLN